VRDLHILNQHWTITRMRIRSSPERRGSSGTERISAREMHGKCARGALPALRWLFPRAMAQRRNGATAMERGTVVQEISREFPISESRRSPTLVAPRAEDVHSLVITLLAASSESTLFPRELRAPRNPSMRVFLGKRRGRRSLMPLGRILGASIYA